MASNRNLRSRTAASGEPSTSNHATPELNTNTQQEDSNTTENTLPDSEPTEPTELTYDPATDMLEEPADNASAARKLQYLNQLKAHVT